MGTASLIWSCSKYRKNLTKKLLSTNFFITRHPTGTFDSSDSGFHDELTLSEGWYINIERNRSVFLLPFFFVVNNHKICWSWDRRERVYCWNQYWWEEYAWCTAVWGGDENRGYHHITLLTPFTSTLSYAQSRAWILWVKKWKPPSFCRLSRIVSDPLTLRLRSISATL